MNCEECSWWSRMKDIDGVGVGVCRVRPPVLVFGGEDCQKPANWGQPVTCVGSGCSECSFIL